MLHLNLEYKIHIENHIIERAETIRDEKDKNYEEIVNMKCDI